MIPSMQPPALTTREQAGYLVTLAEQTNTHLCFIPFFVKRWKLTKVLFVLCRSMKIERE